MRIALVIRSLHDGERECGNPTPALFRRLLRTLAGDGHEMHVLTGAAEAGAMPAELVDEMSGLARVHLVRTEGVAALDGYPCDPMRYSMAVYHTLKPLHAEYRFEWIHGAGRNAELYFALRAQRTLGVFDGTTMSVQVEGVGVVDRFADRRVQTHLAQAMIDHVEWSAILEADALVAQAAESFNVLDRAAAAAERSEFSEGQRRITTGVLIDPELVSRTPPRSGPSGGGGSGVLDVLCFGPLREACGARVVVDAGQRLIASGVAARFRFVGPDLPQDRYDMPMSRAIERAARGAWAEMFALEQSVAPGPRGFAGADVSSLPAALERAVSVALFAGVDGGDAATLAEALAAGACVVVSSHAAGASLVEHGHTGMVYAGADPAELAAALAELAQDPALRERLGTSAQARAREFSPAAWVGRMTHALPRPTPARAPQPWAERAKGVPLVTVLIPFYNLGAYLPETLRSIRAQTFTDYEVIIVDDGSTDPASVALLDHLADRSGDPATTRRLRVVRQPNAGPSAARNTGYREARTPLVLQLDADDILHPEFLARAVDVMCRDPELAVVSCPIAIFNTTPDRPFSTWVPLGFDRELLPFVNVGAAASCLVRREAYLATGGMDELLPAYEDWNLWCFMARLGWKASIIPEHLLAYRVREDSQYRTYGVPHHYAYKSLIQANHATLPTRPDQALRLQLGEAKEFQRHAEHLQRELDAARARITALESELSQVRGTTMTFEQALLRIRRENIRYRIADRLNNALKAGGVQESVKSMARRVMP